MKTHHVVKLNIFDKQIHVFVNIEHDSLERSLTRMGYTASEEEVLEAEEEEHIICQGLTFSREEDVESHGKKPKHIRVIWLRKFNFQNLRHTGTLIHEAQHATISLLKYLGIELSDESEEMYAYLVEFIVMDTIRALKK